LFADCFLYTAGKIDKPLSSERSRWIDGRPPSISIYYVPCILVGSDDTVQAGARGHESQPHASQSS